VRRAFVPILFLLGLRGIAHAQAPPVQNTDSYSDRNVTVQFGMKLDNAATAPGTKVSGTKVETSFWAEARQNGTTPAAPAQPWTHADLDVSVTCGDASPALDFRYHCETVGQNPPSGGALTMVPDAEEPEAPVPQIPMGALISGGAQPVRIASTEFGDGSTIHFLITCKIHFARIVNDVTLDSKIVERKIVATLTACNRVLLLATNEEYATVYNDPMHTQPLSQGYLTTLSPYTSPTQPLYKKAAADAMPLVRPFWDAVHHTIFPDAGKETKWGENAANPDTTWRTQNLDAEMSKYTAFFAFTHGENTNPVHFRASVGPNTVSDGQVYGSEVRTYVSAGRAIPDYQLAIFYACSLGGSTSMPYGFWIVINEQPWKGIAGFSEQCFYRLYRPNQTVPERTLDEHAKKLMEHLSQGFPLQVALNKMQVEAPLENRLVPLKAGGSQMRMTASNGYARLRYVFLEPWRFDPAYATNAASVNTWYWLL